MAIKIRYYTMNDETKWEQICNSNAETHAWMQSFMGFANIIAIEEIPLITTVADSSITSEEISSLMPEMMPVPMEIAGSDLPPRTGVFFNFNKKNGRS